MKYKFIICVLIIIMYGIYLTPVFYIINLFNITIHSDSILIISIALLLLPPYILSLIMDRKLKKYFGIDEPLEIIIK